MELLTIVLVISTVINFVLLFLILSMYKDNNAQKLLIGQIHTALGTAMGKLHMQEMYLQKLGSAFSDFTDLMDGVVEKLNNPMMQFFNEKNALYKTLDGKYAAGSIEDLIEKIKNDGAEDKYLSEDEIDNLRKMFESDDDTDDDEFNPEQGKF